ncbi:MAG: nucleotidyltransferase domain-containing protein [Bacillota bacterium]
MIEVIGEIAEYLSCFKGVEKVLLFGSRARGDNKERSDIDIAVFGELSQGDCGEICYYFSEEVNTLLKIDCVFVKNIDISGKFFESIKREGVVIYERK